MARKLNDLAATRGRRVRFKVKKHAKGRLRLTVCRSNMHVYAQVIDDIKRVTVASASTLEKSAFANSGNKSNIQSAIGVGKLIAQRLKELGVNEVVFDRGPYLYHGCIKALANSAREAGLKF